MSYNLLQEKWIPVLWSNGKADAVGISEALTHAGTIRQIAAPNPMDNVALLRFLVAVLQWCKSDLSAKELTGLRDEAVPGVPDAWLKKLDDNEARFELLGNGRRFYQDSSQSKEPPNRCVSDLFACLPAATEINHFRHVYDRNIALCPACCAVGLVRLPACATQGGQGKSPSINNAPPIYFVAAGTTLLETFLLNWPAQTSHKDRPAWDSRPRDTKKGEIGILEGFTWQPRVVWLAPSIEDVGRRCARCGAAGPLVSKLVFKKGRSRKGDTRSWRDPYVALSVTKNRSDDEGSDVRGRALHGPSDPLTYSMREAELWRQTARAILESVGAGSEDAAILSVAQAPKRLPPPSHFRVACFEPFTKQAKTFDEHGGIWNVPHDLIGNNGLLDAALRELRDLEELSPGKMLMRAMSRNANKRPEIKAGLADAAAAREHSLRQRFEQFLEELGKASGDDAVRSCIQGWRDDVERIHRKELSRACHVIAGDSPLRRQEAINRAQRELSNAMRRWAETSRTELKPAGESKASRRQGKRGEP